MFDTMFFYLFICLLFFGVGEFLGIATKAKLSAVFVSLIFFLVAFMTGLIPGDIINKAGLTQVGKWSVGFVVFSMGTTLNVRQLINEWRTVATAILSMAVLAVGCLVLIPIVGYNEVIVSIPILNGGIVSTQIMTSAAMEQGLTLAAALGTIIYATQKFLGTPIASYFGMREARLVLDEYRRTGVNRFAAAANVNGQQPKPTFFDTHKKYYGSFVCLTICALFAWLSFVLGKLTGVSYSIWALVLGALVGSTGLVPKDILSHGKASGFINVAVFAVIIPSLAKIQFSDLLGLSINTLLLFGATFVILYVCFGILPLWKLQGSRNLALVVACGQLLGFPSTFLIANEVATAAAENEVEKQVVIDAIMSKFLVSGFATVTSFSIIFAGIFENFLIP